jgi:hypothetical protein
MQVLPQQNCGCQTDHYEEHLFVTGNGTYLLDFKLSNEQRDKQTIHNNPSAT